MILIPNQNPPVFSKLGQKTSHLPRPLDGQRWFVAVTKPRNEKKFAWAMHAVAVSFFLPMQVRQTATNGKVHELIFPGFCFFLGYPEDLYRAWESRRIKSVLKTDDQKGFREDLRDVARVVHAGIKLTKLEDIQRGALVRVCEPGHALEGLKARVDLRNKNRVWLDVRMVGSSSFEIDARYLQVVKSP